VKLADIEWSNKQINEAGEFLSKGNRSFDDPETVRMSLTVSQWRSAHEYSLQMVISILRRHLKSLGWTTAILSGRTKRLRSIVAKLMRQRSMMLTTMQDLGGCRIVLDTIEQVEILAGDIRDRLSPKLSRGGEPREYNYVAKPKPDGYRSIHFVVRYQSISREHKILRTEIQIRSLLQHRWATAVETVDLFTGQTLKTGGGDPRWKRFFALTGSLFALKENRETVPDTPSEPQLMDDINVLAAELRVVERLQRWSTVMRSIFTERRDSQDAYYLVQLDVEAKMTYIVPFGAHMHASAHSSYLAAEQANANFPTRSAVLVSAHSLADVKQGYPGYYGDTKAFLVELEFLRS
jgi:ppGpp synthetase/RelA/SpoT-type nucleotidyltranferase